METDSEWTETTDGGGAPIVEKRIGDFWLSVQKADDDSGEWDAFVDVLGRFAMDAHADRKRLTVRSSYRHTSLAAAHASANAMLREIVDPLVATARAEAALAEREACAQIAGDVCDSDVSGYSSLGAREVAHAIRARTTPATLSTETLAAIVEARGLRVVEPELLSGLDATEHDETSERATCSWCEKTAVCAGNDEGDPWALSCDEHCAHGGESGSHIYLSDHAALIALVNSAYAERDEARAELASMREDVAELTGRVEAEIAAAAEAVRARAIAECEARLNDLFEELIASVSPRQSEPEFTRRLSHARGVTTARDAVRALAVTQPASEDAGPSWAWDESLGCFVVRFSVVELRAHPDGRWWIWESEQSHLDGRAGNVREAMLAAVARERQDTRHRSDVSPEVHAALARLEAQLVPLVARAALSQPAPTDPADVDPAAGALR